MACHGDHQEAQAAIDRLAAIPTDPRFIMRDLPLLRLRALLAKAHGDEVAHRDFRDRYRAMATSLMNHLSAPEPIVKWSR